MASHRKTINIEGKIFPDYGKIEERVVNELFMSCQLKYRGTLSNIANGIEENYGHIEITLDEENTFFLDVYKDKIICDADVDWELVLEVLEVIVELME